MSMTRKTRRRLPPTAREIAKALAEIEHGFRMIDRLFGPKPVRQGLTNLVEMEIMATAVQGAMPKTNRKKATQVDAVTCPEHGIRLHPSCQDCVRAWEDNSLIALKIQGIDRPFDE